MQNYPTFEINLSVRSQESHSDTDTSVNVNGLVNGTMNKKVQFIESSNPKLFVKPFEVRRRTYPSPERNGDQSEEYSDYEEEHYVVPQSFQRGKLRHSDRYTSTSKLNVNEMHRGSMRAFCRNDPMRKTVHVARQSSFQPKPAYVPKEETPPKKVSKSKLASLWRRFTGPAKKPANEKTAESRHFEKLCTYAGVMGDFQRLHRGREISIIICGSEKVGKSALINSIVANAALSNDFKIFRKEERFPTKKMPTRIPDIFSLKYNYNQNEWIIDLIEIPKRKYDGNDKAALDAYYRACDGAICIADCKQTDTTLELVISAKELKQNGVPFVIVGNDSGKLAMSQKDMISKLAEKLQVSFYETNLKKAEETVIAALQQLLSTIISQRTETAIQVTKIWGTCKDS